MSAGAATALSVVLVAFVCFLAGLLARTVTAQHIVNALELSVLSKIPAYEYLKQERASALGATQSTDLAVVLVPMEGGWQLGLQTERLGDELVPVFVPGAPNPHSGSVFFFPADIVRPAGVELLTALNCLRRCDAGASALAPVGQPAMWGITAPASIRAAIIPKRETGRCRRALRWESQ